MLRKPRILIPIFTVILLGALFCSNVLINYVRAQEVHLAHAVAGSDQDIVDLDNNGSENIDLDGTQSHTHAFGETIATWSWTENTTVIANTPTPSVLLTVGTHNITLTMVDSAGNSASDDVIVVIRGPTDVPGLAGYYYDFSTETDLGNIPDVTGRKPDWGQIEANLNTSFGSGAFRSTPLTINFSARYVGIIKIPTDGSYTFAFESDDGTKLYIDGNLIIDNDGVHGMDKVSQTIPLTAGEHDILIEYFQGTGPWGLKFYWTIPGGTEEIVPGSVLFHNHATLTPVVNALNPIFGPLTGGNKVAINGFGFANKTDQITVNFGLTPITGGSLTKIDDYNLEVDAPGGSGTVTVDAVTPNGTSNSRNYLYSDTAPPAIQFTDGTLNTPFIDGPTSITFGPDGKLYVGTQFGVIWVLTLDDNYDVVDSYSTDIIQTSEPNFVSILGLAFNPYEFDPANPKLYVTHSWLFHGGPGFHSGKVSTLSGLNLNTKNDLITGLPVSDHDHAVNGMEFSNNGKMYIQIGGETNAGVPAAAMGNLSEGPLSAATLVADIYKPTFDGSITYDANGNQTGGFDVKPFAVGERNPFDIVLHSNGYLYGTDNGPNFTFGPQSTGCSTETPDPEAPDELNLILQGKYYGHPNRYLGATDPSLCVYHPPTDSSTGNYVEPMTTLPSSTNGIVEYRANTFAGQMRGHLLLGKWNKALFDVVLSSDGKSVVSKKTLSPNGGVDVTVDPYGVIFSSDNLGDKITYLKPNEPTPPGPHIISVFPYRGMLQGGNKVLITGTGFSPTASVTIDGSDCTILSAISTKIECSAPEGNVVGPKDVMVTDGTESAILTGGYSYLGTPSDWETKKVLPTGLGEVTAAAVNGYVYIFAGHTATGDNLNTYKYDPATDEWQTLAGPTVGVHLHHSPAVVIDGKVYVPGGLGPESSQLIIYDPGLDQWSLGEPINQGGVPFAVGSSSTGVIDGKLYLAGGIHNGATVTNTFVYDPALDIWTELAPMNQGRNHAAGVAYDGNFYVFGGRCCGGNTAGAGTDTVQIYDPITNTWDDTTAQVMPTARGGMGNAVEANGELIVIGGEGGGPSNGTFPNVEAYNPSTNTWRILPNILTPRHGIYPVVLNGLIYVVGGGTAEGPTVSDLNEVLDPGNGSGVPTTLYTNIKINSGGLSLTDIDGNSWVEDKFFNTGESISTTETIVGTPNQALYQAARVDTDPVNPDLEYKIPVENGKYHVTLHFAETQFTSAGVRIFNTSIEGTEILSGFDIYGEVGSNTALTKSFNTQVTDKSMDILFTPVVGSPIISAIEIVPVQPAISINAGGAQFTDSSGVNWQADNFYNAGYPSVTTNPISNTPDQTIYQSERWIPTETPQLEYSIPVADGNYLVKLHFAETYYTQSGSRAFNVSLEGNQVINNLDIADEVGVNSALIKTFTSTVSDGVLNILFDRVIENPKVSGIQIFPILPTDPKLDVDMDPIQFPNTRVGTASADLALNITNNGASDLNISDISVIGTDSGEFNFTTPLPLVVAPGSTQSVDATFTPSTVGKRVAQLKIVSNDPGGIRLINISGFGLDGGAIRINSGGVGFVAADGKNWLADQNFNTGINSSTTNTINGTQDQALYQTYKWDLSVLPEMEYKIPVLNGSYQVILHFAESFYSSVGSRVFDVSIEGNQVLNDLDIVSEAGPNNALTKSFTTTVSDDVLNILFNRVVENPNISGIEIIPLTQSLPLLAVSPGTVDFSKVGVASSSADISVSLTNNGGSDLLISDINVVGSDAADFTFITQEPYTIPPGESVVISGTFTPSLPGVRTAELQIVSNDPLGVKLVGLSGEGINASQIRVNAGGGKYTDSNNKQWLADKYFNTGFTNSTATPVANTADQAIFQSNRWDASELPELEYAIPVANGEYEVTLYFAETSFGAPGLRVFDVSVEGNLVLNDFDIVAKAGANKAFTQSFYATVSDGSLNILLSHVIENPTISGIEIVALGAQPSQMDVVPTSVGFPATPKGDSAAPATFTLTNNGGSNLTIYGIIATGANSEDFTFDNQPTYDIAPGTSVQFNGIFTPSNIGARSATIEITSNDPSGVIFIPLSGEGVVATNIRINSGGSSHIDTLGNYWRTDNNFNTGFASSTGNAISGTTDQAIFQTNRWDGAELPEMEYSIPLENGGYIINLLFTEAFYSNAGQRVFNVSLEDSTVLINFDIASEVGANTALTKTFATTITDGNLNILFSHVTDNPQISGIEILKDTENPTVSISSPNNSASVSGVVQINAAAADNVGIASVEFYVDGILLSTDTTAPFNASWDTTALAIGSIHNLSAKAYDANGNSATSSGITVSIEDALPPTTSITSPTNGAFLKGTVNLAASASDNVAVTKVEFYANQVLIGTDLTSPYEFSWNTLGSTNGVKSLITKAYDAAGNVASSIAISVTVDNQQPTLTITNPTNNAIVPKNSDVNITANSTDNIGVTKVEFLVDNTLKCTDTTSPYSCIWKVPGAKNKQYSITVKSYDQAGNITTASIVVKSSS